MAWEMRELQGSLFKNNRKTEEKHPDYTGSCKVGGIEYWVSGWVKEAKVGDKKFLSLAFTIKNGTGQQSSPVGASLVDEDVPF